MNAQAVNLLGRAATLLNGFGHVLSDHERDLTAEAVGRLRRHGPSAVVTLNEMPVIEEAVGAMQAAREQWAAGQLKAALG